MQRFSAEREVRPLATSSEIQRRMEALALELKQAANEESHRATISYFSSQTAIIVSLGCGVLAAIIGGVFDMYPRAVGGIAALPPLIAYLATSFRLELRQNWYYRKAARLDALRSRSLYQLPEEPTAEHISAIAAARDKLVIDMQHEWYETITKNFLEFKANPPANPPSGESG